MARFASSYTPSRCNRAAASAEAGGAPASVATLALRAGRRGQRPGDPLTGSIVQSTTYLQAEVGGTVAHCYSRVSNPTVASLEESLGELEGALPAVTFGTGLGAETALLLSLLESGDHVVLGRGVYGGTTRLAQRVLSRFGVGFSFVDSTDARAVEAAITDRTKLVFVETPANPTLELTDIAAVAGVTRARGVVLAVDNTFLTAVAQRPLDLGADITVYSTTKHIEGHSCALGGALVTREARLLDGFRFIRKSTGGIQSPLNAWLTERGLRTLPLRLSAQSAGALRVARALAGHPLVGAVYYPGLEGFAQRELAERQHLGGVHGGVVTFEPAAVPGGEGAERVARRVLEGVELCALVEHVGSVETLITHPATMTHADVPAEQRRAAGIGDGLIRLSVGLEDPADVIADLDRALVRAAAASGPVRGAGRRVRERAAAGAVAAEIGGAL